MKFSRIKACNWGTILRLHLTSSACRCTRQSGVSELTMYTRIWRSIECSRYICSRARPPLIGNPSLRWLDGSRGWVNSPSNGVSSEPASTRSPDRFRWHDGAEVSASGWRSGGPRFKSRPRLTSQSWSLSYQLNQLGSKAASDSTLKQLTLAGYQILVLYFPIGDSERVLIITPV